MAIIQMLMVVVVVVVGRLMMVVLRGMGRDRRSHCHTSGTREIRRDGAVMMMVVARTRRSGLAADDGGRGGR